MNILNTSNRAKPTSQERVTPTLEFYNITGDQKFTVSFSFFSQLTISNCRRVSLTTCGSRIQFHSRTNERRGTKHSRVAKKTRSTYALIIVNGLAGARSNVVMNNNIWCIICHALRIEFFSERT